MALACAQRPPLGKERPVLIPSSCLARRGQHRNFTRPCPELALAPAPLVLGAVELLQSMLRELHCTSDKVQASPHITKPGPGPSQELAAGRQPMPTLRLDHQLVNGGLPACTGAIGSQDLTSLGLTNPSDR